MPSLSEPASLRRSWLGKSLTRSFAFLSYVLPRFSALSRIGKTVLHLDKVRRLEVLSKVPRICREFECACVPQHDYYGGDDASFGLEEFVAWHAGLPSDGAWVPFVKSADGSAPASLPAVLAPVARRFSLDISPRAVSSRGEMVDLLVASETTHYLDFKVRIAVVNAALFCVGFFSCICAGYR